MTTDIATRPSVALEDGFRLPDRPDVLSESEMGAYAYQVDLAVQQCQKGLSKYEQHLGLSLLLVQRERLWKTLEYTSFAAYLAGRGISHSSGYRYMQIAAVYLLPEDSPATPEELAEMGLNRSIAIASSVKGKSHEEASDIVADAMTLTPGDLHERVDELKGKTLTPQESFLGGVRSQLEQFVMKLEYPLLEEPFEIFGEITNAAARWRAFWQRLSPPLED